MVDGTYAELFQRVVAAQVRRNHELIEMMCEQMLVTPGHRGVLVTELDDGSVSAELTYDVPFGEIHYRRGPVTSWPLPETF